MNLTETWAWFTTSPLTALTLTVGLYWACDKLWRRLGHHALLTPILTASALIGGVLLLTGWDYAAYAEGTSFLTFLLGPATVALGLPLHRQASKVIEGAPMVLGTVLLGAVFSVLSGYWFATWLGATHEMALTMAPKSATTPIAIALVQQLGGIAPVAVLFVMVAGISGAVIGPWILTLARVTDPRARGLALGVASHGIGTARALQEGQTQGAFAGLGMGLTGLVISLSVTGLIPV